MHVSFTRVVKRKKQNLAEKTKAQKLEKEVILYIYKFARNTTDSKKWLSTCPDHFIPSSKDIKRLPLHIDAYLKESFLSGTFAFL